MSLTLNLLKAEHVGARAFRGRLFKFLKEDGPLVITEHGRPARVILGYDDVLELFDIIDELTDPATVQAVRESRKAIAAGAKGIPFLEVFKEKHQTRKKK